MTTANLAVAGVTTGSQRALPRPSGSRHRSRPGAGAGARAGVCGAIAARSTCLAARRRSGSPRRSASSSRSASRPTNRLSRRVVARRRRAYQRGALLARRNAAARSATSSFFELEWLTLDEAVAAPIIAAPACAHYRHHLAAARLIGPHMLSEPGRLLEGRQHRPAGVLAPVRRGLSVGAHLRGRRGRRTPDAERERRPRPCCTTACRRCASSAARALTGQLRQQSLMLTYTFNIIAQDHALSDRFAPLSRPDVGPPPQPTRSTVPQSMR